MPDESCRNCGGHLTDFSQCAECKQITRFICKACRNITTEQFHSQCLLGLLGIECSQSKPLLNFPNAIA